MEKLIVNTLQKGGNSIGFSFCIHNNYRISSYLDFFKNKHTNCEFQI